MENIFRYLAFGLLLLCAVMLFQAKEAAAGHVKTKCQYCNSTSYGMGCTKKFDDNVDAAGKKYHKHPSEGGTLCVWCGYEVKTISKTPRCPKSPTATHRNY